MSIFNFVEIGTSCFKTLIEIAPDWQVGLSIEPVKSYIDMLPSKPNVHKLWGAIIASEEDRDLKFYYIEPEVIDQLNLGSFMKGCNSLGKPHDFHTHYCIPSLWPALAKAKDRSTVDTKNLIELGIVKTINVPTFTFAEVVSKYNIEAIQYLRIDTEGMDCKIINSIISAHKNNAFSFKPTVIEFETNWHTDEKEVEETISKLIEFGYEVVSRGGNTTVKLK